MDIQTGQIWASDKLARYGDIAREKVIRATPFYAILENCATLKQQVLEISPDCMAGFHLVESE